MNDFEKVKKLFDEIGVKYYETEEFNFKDYPEFWPEQKKDEFYNDLRVIISGNEPPIIMGFHNKKHIGFFKHHL